MAHYNVKNADRESQKIDARWLGASAAVGRMCSAWAARTDLIANVGPDLVFQGDAPAVFTPSLGEIGVNATRCFGPGITPELAEKIEDRRHQFDWPSAVGAIFHEAMHSRFSLWDLHKAQADLSKAEFMSMVYLEEGRIEAQGLELFPHNSGFLRSMVLSLVTTDVHEVLTDSNTVTAANVTALVLARVDAGSLRDDDVEDIRVLINEYLSDATIEQLREVWRKFQDYRDHTNGLGGMYELAREWVRIVNDAAKANGEPGMDDAQPSDGDGDGDGSGEGAFVKALRDALDDAAEGAAIAATGELADTEMLESWERERNERGESNKARRRDEKEARDIFASGASTGEVQPRKSSSRLTSVRQPTGAERAAAVKVARALEKAKYRDRSETEVTSVLPPGRLRVRSAMQADAMRSKGVISQAEPWRRTVRKHTDDPTLNIGVMVDISASMALAMEPMAVTAWVMSEAVRRVQGRTAMVYYGNDVFPTLKPGQHLDQVNIYSAPDMTEKFGQAFSALNGALGLTWGTGARLLVVVSDGIYTGPESSAAMLAVQACQKAGVGVLWLAPNKDGVVMPVRYTAGTSGIVEVIGDDVTAAAESIGRAAAKALEAVA